jgi:hypothetical protein
MLPFPLNLIAWVLIIVLCAAGALWLLNQYPPDPAIHKFARIVIIAIAFIAIVWMLIALAGGAPVPRRAMDIDILVPLLA